MTPNRKKGAQWVVCATTVTAVAIPQMLSGVLPFEQIVLLLLWLVLSVTLACRYFFLEPGEDQKNLRRCHAMAQWVGVSVVIQYFVIMFYYMGITANGLVPYIIWGLRLNVLLALGVTAYTLRGWAHSLF